jgi:hypothetical protein
MKRSLTEIVKDILSVVIDGVERQYPIYPHTVEKLEEELNKALSESDLTQIEVSIKSS